MGTGGLIEIGDKQVLVGATDGSRLSSLEEVLAHELFHAFQDDQGIRPLSYDDGEIQATEVSDAVVGLLFNQGSRIYPP